MEAKTIVTDWPANYPMRVLRLDADPSASAHINQLQFHCPMASTHNHPAITTTDLFNDLFSLMEALLNRASEPASKDQPIDPDHLLTLHELSIRLDILLETLEDQRRMYMDVYSTSSSALNTSQPPSSE